MFTAQKIRKARNAQPDELEESVAQALYELQTNSEKLKAHLRELHISSAKEVDVAEGKSCICIFVPVPMLAQFQKLIKENALIEELQKKFSGKLVIILAERRIMRKETRRSRQHSQSRPVSRTLTSVHEAILDDLVYPTEIVGKRTRVRLDGSKLLKVHLNPEAVTRAQEKTGTYARVYKSLTGKDVAFEFPKF